MALPRERQDVIAWVESFLQERKANGFVAEALKQSGQEEAKVAS